MTLVETTKPSTISLQHHAERKAPADLDSQSPIQSRSLESQELFELLSSQRWPLAAPVGFSFFCLKNNGSQTSACIWIHLRVPSHKCPGFWFYTFGNLHFQQAPRWSHCCYSGNPRVEIIYFQISLIKH